MQAKAWAKDIKKTMENPATLAGETLFLDATGPFELLIGGTRFDAKIINQFLRKTWSSHMKMKDQILDMIWMHIEALKGQGKEVKFLRCDNASEQGGKIAHFAEKGAFNWNTQPQTHFHKMVQWNKDNYGLEQSICNAFSSIADRESIHLLQAKAELMATKLLNLAWSMQIDSVPNSKFGNEVQHLHPENLTEFGWIGYVMTRKQIKKKWTDNIREQHTVSYMIL